MSRLRKDPLVIGPGWVALIDRFGEAGKTGDSL